MREAEALRMGRARGAALVLAEKVADTGDFPKEVEEELQPKLSLSFLHSLVKPTNKPGLTGHLDRY